MLIPLAIAGLLQCVSQQTCELLHFTTMFDHINTVLREDDDVW